MWSAGTTALQTQAQVDIELAAHGVAIVEIAQSGGPLDLPPVVTLQPAHHRQDADGDHRPGGRPRLAEDLPATRPARRSRGTLNNCAGGKTPWGTVLTAEENFNQYFANRRRLPASDPRKAIHARYGLPTGDSEPRLGEVLQPLRRRQGAERAVPLRLGGRDRPLRPELDAQEAHRARPLQARSRDERRAADGQVVVYTGDDERFDYVYKFVSDRHGTTPSNRQRQLRPARRRHAVRRQVQRRRHRRWLPLVYGQGPLTAANGFATRATC